MRGFASLKGADHSGRENNKSESSSTPSALRQPESKAVELPMSASWKDCANWAIEHGNVVSDHEAMLLAAQLWFDRCGQAESAQESVKTRHMD